MSRHVEILNSDIILIMGKDWDQLILREKIAAESIISNHGSTIRKEVIRQLVHSESSHFSLSFVIPPGDKARIS